MKESGYLQGEGMNERQNLNAKAQRTQSAAKEFNNDDAFRSIRGIPKNGGVPSGISRGFLCDPSRLCAFAFCL